MGYCSSTLTHKKKKKLKFLSYPLSLFSLSPRSYFFPYSQILITNYFFLN
uniref:Uncharacterized protein n=1 Tax=Lepeophtheirus salmonis TaxID=72036 RepID=A0A0K2SZB8_LEPSM